MLAARMHDYNQPPVIFDGGIPLVVGGSIVGAVGTSAGTVEQDIAVAEAAVGTLTW